ncbi:MAG: DUF951 domain-containing protein [Culicoidibacterales bacterium]
MNKQYEIGTIVQMTKKHPCGSFNWIVVRVGMDIKIKCEGCSRIVMLPKPQFEKRVKAVLK